jgi:hypothetical protein
MQMLDNVPLVVLVCIASVTLLLSTNGKNDVPYKSAGVLHVYNEFKLYKLLPGIDHTVRLEASGLATSPNDASAFLTAMDDWNLEVAVIRAPFIVNGPNNTVDLLDSDGAGGDGSAVPGYEGATYSVRTDRLYLVVETVRTEQGRLVSQINEYGRGAHLAASGYVDFEFVDDNKGFEGLTAVNVSDCNDDGDCVAPVTLVALCEGNLCVHGGDVGNGRMAVLHSTLDGDYGYTVRRVVELPKEAAFEDYSALDIDGNGNIIVASQTSSTVWIGTIDVNTWTIGNSSAVYEFQRTEKGKPIYCTVEGVAWINAPTTFAIVSDAAKSDMNAACFDHDQSFAIVTLPSNSSN